MPRDAQDQAYMCNKRLQSELLSHGVHNHKHHHICKLKTALSEQFVNFARAWNTRSNTCIPDTRLPKWSSTLKRSEGKMPPLGKLVIGSNWLSEALMAAASLARSPPNPRVELLPSQSAQLLGVVLSLLATSASA